MQEAWEFRYDESGRQRYYARRWTPDEQHPTDPRYFVADETMEWTDYLGAQPYGDYTVSVDAGTPVATPLHRYLAGLGLHAQQTVDGQGDPTVYLHGDMVRSTMLTTDEVGAPVTSLAYTAFGEPVTYDAGSQTWRVGFPAAGGTRYGYAGGFGYESGLISLQGVNPALPPVTLQHVGERWYDPAIGRFVQRDPIGLSGGTNTYTYCSNSPLAAADPTGLATDVGQNVPDGWKPAGGLYGPPTPPGGWHGGGPMTPGAGIPSPGAIDGFLGGIINGKPGAAASAASGAATLANFRYRWGIGALANKATAVCVGIWAGWNSGKGYEALSQAATGRKLSDWIGDLLGQGTITIGGWGGNRGYVGW